MEFKEKQFDGAYEVSAIELDIEGQLLRGLLFFPREYYIKPYKIIVYYHDFPQLFSLYQIVNKLEFLLELGYSILVFNFRGYRNSQGEISLHSQLQDGLIVAKFIHLMVEKGIFKQQEINLIGHGFGCYIALLLCSMNHFLNKVILISPIIDLEKFVSDESFVKTLEYINRYLPGYVHGIENIKEFLTKTKSELNLKEFQIKKVINRINFKDMEIILGKKNKWVEISEINSIFEKLPKFKIVFIEEMDHNWIEEDILMEFQEEIVSFLIS